MEWIIIYIVMGAILFGILWKALGIQWNAEAPDVKLVMILTPVAWPLILLFILIVWKLK